MHIRASMHIISQRLYGVKTGSDNAASQRFGVWTYFQEGHWKVIEKTLSENGRRRLRVVLGVAPLSGFTCRDYICQSLVKLSST